MQPYQIHINNTVLFELSFYTYATVAGYFDKFLLVDYESKVENFSLHFQKNLT